MRLLGAVFLTTLFASAVDAQGLSFHCPTEGLLTGPLQILDMPNPLAGWDFFLEEGTLQKVELSPAPKRDGFWLITCHIGTNGASIEITAHLPGTKSCQIEPNSGSIISQRDGSQS